MKHARFQVSARGFAKRPFRRGSCAFTLMEVLVSLAIFSLAAVALGTAYVNLLSAHDALSRSSPDREAFALARRALLGAADLQEAETGGEVVAPDERRIRWSAEIEPLPVADLFSVVLKVEVPDAGDGTIEDYTESHTLLRPTWSEAADRKKLLDDARQRLTEERARL